MLYRVYVVGSFIAGVLPIKAAYFLANIISYIYYLFARRDRAELADNLRMVLGKETDKKIIKKHIRTIFRNFAKYLADFSKFTSFTKDYIEKNVEVVGLENVDSCLEKKKGVIVLSIHLGNWEMGGAVFAALGYPAHAIVLEHKDKRINDFFIKQRLVNNFKSIPIGLKLRECYKVIKRNEALAIAGDKDYTGSGEYVEFFGKKALMPKGAAVLSLRTGAPIVMCFLIRKKDDTFRLTFGKPIEYERTDNYEEDVINLMKIYIKDFEKKIRQHPDQWYAFKRIWKQE